MADKIATRQAYGEALIELVEKNDKVVVLDADLANATQTCKVAKAHPEKFYNCGIAEANMVDIAAGMSTMGLIPYCSSFAMFAAGRAYEQIRNSIAYPHFNVKICATHAGVSVGEDGGSHQCIEDIALMRVIPGMTVICPADANEAKAATMAIADFEGPVYMRLARLATPVFEGDMVKRALGAIDLDWADLIIIENVGNLVCTVDFDLGADLTAMILSVPEGHDKPLKYPGIFQASDAVILSKVDTLPVFDFDEAAFDAEISDLNPNAEVFRISSKTGQGIDAWADFLAGRIEVARSKKAE